MERSGSSAAWRVGLPVSLGAITLIVFSRALGNDFVGWDDPQYLLDNFAFRGFDGQRLWWMFTNTDFGHYMPLVWLSWAVDHALWGMKPVGYHLGNVLIHAVNAVLFYFLTLRLLKLAGGGGIDDWHRGARPLCAAFAALFFALHPLRVESVAWATERKDVLLGFFYLSALLVYVRGRGRTWPATLVTYFLALLCKSMAATLPAVLLVLDVYPLRRLAGEAGWLNRHAARVWLEKLPFLALSAAAAVLVVVGHERASSTWQADLSDLPARCAVLAHATVFYVYKTLAPVRLSPLYEIPAEIDPRSLEYVVSFVWLLSASGGVFLLRRRVPGVGAAWISFLVILLPVSGIVPVGPQLVADRYAYLSCLGFATLLAGCAEWALRRGHVRAVLAGGVAVLLSLAIGTWRQIGVWHDSRSLWSHAVALDPECGLCHSNLGVVLLNEGNLEEAESHADRSIRLRPDKAMFSYNRGVILETRGRFAEAVQSYKQALERQPDLPVASLNLSKLLMRDGRAAEALHVLREQVRLSPGHRGVALQLAWLLATCPDRRLRNGPQAVEIARRACAGYGKDDPAALGVLAAAYTENGELDRAAQTARRAFMLAMDRGAQELADRFDAQLREIQRMRREP